MDHGAHLLRGRRRTVDTPPTQDHSQEILDGQGQQRPTPVFRPRHGRAVTLPHAGLGRGSGGDPKQ